MKKLILSTLTVLALSAGINAQNVNIPDANFKSYLVGNAAINTSGDTEIQVSEASAFTGGIYYVGPAVSDLTGIEAFTNLTALFCTNGNLTTIDISQNTSLVELTLNNNTLTSLDVSQNTQLTDLECQYNSISILDLSQNSNLSFLTCYDNSIATLDLSNNTALETVAVGTNNSLSELNIANGNNTNITTFDAASSPQLTCITVDDVTYSTANWTSIDAQTSFSTNCGACIVNIPDANFKAYLVGNAAINTNGNTEIECTEASATTYMSCNGLSIADLTGLEAFTSLGLFYCENNLLTSIDISANTSLTTLYCKGNQLTSLDISNNTLLTNLRCHENSITSLDVTTAPDLQYLFCYDNQISSLDLSQNVLLEELVVANNNLTSLDIISNTLIEELQIGQNQIASIDLSQNTALLRIFCRNTALTNLDCSNSPSLNWIVVNDNDLQSLDVSNGNNTNVGFFWAHNNPNLTCIQVDDVAFSTSNWTSSSFNFDAASSFSLNCVSTVLVSSITVQGQGGASTITTAGGTLQMEANVLPANADDGTYTWSVMDGSGSATIDANGLLTAITDGTVDVIATANDASGIAGTATITISNQTAGINENGVAELVEVYPNPVSNILFIQLGEQKATAINILDLSGKVVQTIANNNVKSIDVSDLQQGVYILKVVTNKGVSTKRFIKQ
jgi:Leucine-rich repeat (LRR) protein